MFYVWKKLNMDFTWKKCGPCVYAMRERCEERACIKPKSAKAHSAFASRIVGIAYFHIFSLKLHTTNPLPRQWVEWIKSTRAKSARVKKCGTVLREFLCNHRIKWNQNLKRLMILLHASESRNSNYLYVAKFFYAVAIHSCWKISGKTHQSRDKKLRRSSAIVAYIAKPFAHACCEYCTPKYQLEWKQIFYVCPLMPYNCKWNTYQKSNEWLNLYDI